MLRQLLHEHFPLGVSLCSVLLYLQKYYIHSSVDLILSYFYRQEAAGALWNLSFDDRNREAIAAAGGVQALVCLAYFFLIEKSY